MIDSVIDSGPPETFAAWLEQNLTPKPLFPVCLEGREGALQGGCEIFPSFRRSRASGGNPGVVLQKLGASL